MSEVNDDATQDAEELAADADLLDEEEGEAQPRRGMPGKKLVLLIVLPVLLLLSAAGGGAYYFLSGEDEATAGAENVEGAEGGANKIVFYALPDILVNINSGGKQNNYLKVSLSLELTSQADMEIVRDMMPRIIDNFQIYLRELRIEDLNGSAGPMRLKEELLARIHTATESDRIKDILFRQILVQ